jgi:hypothetical protein
MESPKEHFTGGRPGVCVGDHGWPPRRAAVRGDAEEGRRLPEQEPEVAAERMAQKVCDQADGGGGSHD